MLYIYELPIGTNALEEFAKEAGKFDFHSSIYILPNKLLTAEIKKKRNIQSGSMDLLINEIIKLSEIENRKPVSSFVRELLVEKIIRDLQTRKQLAYFSDSKANAGLVNSICLLISDLSNRQVDCDNFTNLVEFSRFNADLDKNLDKLYDLAKIYTLYTRYLAALDELDIFDRYKIAANILDNIDELPWQAIYISDYYSLTQLELDIIKKLSRITQVHVALNYEKDRSEIFAALQHLRDTLLGFPQATIAQLPLSIHNKNHTLNFLCTNFYNTHSPVYTEQVQNIQIHGFHDKNQEILYIVSDIKKKILNGATPHDFLLVGRDLQSYPNLSDYFTRVGVPSSLPKIVHLAQHFISRLAIDIFALAFMPFSKNNLQKILFSPPVVTYLDFDKDQLEKIFFEYDFDSINQLGTLLTHIQKQHKLDLANEHAALQRLSAIISSMPRKATASEYTQTLKNLLQELQILNSLGLSHQQHKLDTLQLKIALEVYQALIAVIDNLSSALILLYGDEHLISGRSFSRYLSKALADKTVTLLQGDQNTVKVLQAADMQSSTAKHVYLLGLNDGLFPKYRNENWLLNNSEMYNLQISMTNEAEMAASEDAFFFASSIAMAEESLTLTYLENERVRKSKYLTEVKRIMPDIPEYTHRNMLPEALAQIYDWQSLSDFLAFQLNTNSINLLPELASQWLQARWSAQPAKLLSIPDNQTISTGKSTANTMFSITQLEDYAVCPFKYLLNHIWQPTAWRLASLDNTALTKGSFLHKVVEQFVQKYLGKKLPEFETALHALEQIFEKTFAATPVENTYTWQLGKTKLWKVLVNWLTAEYQTIGEYKFYATEWEFGLQNEFKIADIHIRGKIDRIDVSPAAIRITDYKYKNTVKFKDFEENRANLQIPLYMLAVDSLMNNDGQRQLQGNYFSFAKAQSSNYLNTQDADYPITKINEQISLILTELGEQLNNGYFAPVLNKDCEYCEYITACRAQQLQLEEEEYSE